MSFISLTDKISYCLIRHIDIRNQFLSSSNKQHGFKSHLHLKKKKNWYFVPTVKRNHYEMDTTKLNHIKTI